MIFAKVVFSGIDPCSLEQLVDVALRCRIPTPFKPAPDFQYNTEDAFEYALLVMHFMS